MADTIDVISVAYDIGSSQEILENHTYRPNLRTIRTGIVRLVIATIKKIFKKDLAHKLYLTPLEVEPNNDTMNTLLS